MPQRARIAFLAAPIMDLLEDGRWIPTLQDAAREGPQLGVYLLVGILERAGFEVDLFDWVAFPDQHIEEITDTLSGYDLVLFSCNSMNWAVVRAVACKVRQQSPSTKMCVGGPHPTHYPESVAASGIFDVYFRGEADCQIVRIVEMLLRGEKEALPGLGVPADGHVPMVHQEMDLSRVDWRPAWHRLPEGRYKSLNAETSRGCKFQCTFCSITAKNNWRGYASETGLAQIEYAEKFAGRTLSGKINIVDDTFTTDHGRIHDLVSQLDKKRYADRLMYDATIVDIRSRDLMEALAPFSHSFLVGAEVATKQDAKKIRKASTPALVEQAAANLDKVGIANKAVFSFIFGFPWQSKTDCLDQLKFIKDLIIRYDIRSYLQWYWPMPGSPIWNELKQDGRVTLEMVDQPGFYRSNEWFYPVRRLVDDEVREIDQKVHVVRGMLRFTNRSTAVDSLQYASPLHYYARKVLRNPFLEAEQAAAAL